MCTLPSTHPFLLATWGDKCACEKERPAWKFKVCLGYEQPIDFWQGVRPLRGAFGSAGSGKKRNIKQMIEDKEYGEFALFAILDSLSVTLVNNESGLNQNLKFSKDTQ